MKSKIILLVLGLLSLAMARVHKRRQRSIVGASIPDALIDKGGKRVGQSQDQSQNIPDQKGGKGVGQSQDQSQNIPDQKGGKGVGKGKFSPDAIRGHLKIKFKE